MIPVVLLVSALLLGYAVAISLLMAAIFGIALLAPGFVARNYRIRSRYKLVEELVWLLCAVAGGYVTAAMPSTIPPWFTGTLLAVVMILVFWTNAWEMRQRGVPHQMLMTLASVVGVTAGFVLRLR